NEDECCGMKDRSALLYLEPRHRRCSEECGGPSDSPSRWRLQRAPPRSRGKDCPLGKNYLGTPTQCCENGQSECGMNRRWTSPRAPGPCAFVTATPWLYPCCARVRLHHGRRNSQPKSQKRSCCANRLPWNGNPRIRLQTCRGPSAERCRRQTPTRPSWRDELVSRACQDDRRRRTSSASATDLCVPEHILPLRRMEHECSSFSAFPTLQGRYCELWIGGGFEARRDRSWPGDKT